jgi:hypothetical protein
LEISLMPPMVVAAAAPADEHRQPQDYYTDAVFLHWLYIRWALQLLPANEAALLSYLMHRLMEDPEYRAASAAPLDRQTVLNGKEDSEENLIECGAGLSRSAAAKAMTRLERCGIVLRLAAPESANVCGAYYGLAMSAAAIDWDEVVALNCRGRHRKARPAIDFEKLKRNPIYTYTMWVVETAGGYPSD